MKTNINLAVLTAMSMLVSSASYAEVVSGELFWSDSYTADDLQDFVKSSKTVDFHSFNSLGGLYIFDVTASGGYDSEGNYLGTGLQDSYIWVFRDDGLLDPTDWVAENDDWHLGVDGESGSVHLLDSFLSLQLEVGAYFLAVGSCCEELNIATQNQEYIGLPDYAGDTVEFTGSLGTYTVNIAQSSVVPIPGAVWFMGGGLISLIGLAKRQTWSSR